MSVISAEIWKNSYFNIHEKIYDVKLTKQKPSEWVEKNIILPDGVSRYTGLFGYHYSPYAVEIVNRIASNDPTRVVAIMKCAQIGLTQGLIIPGLLYIIAEDPAPILFMAGDKDLAKTSIQERFDPILHASGLKDLIRPSTMRARNQRTGDTDLYKEYAGGRLTIEGTNNVTKMRQISVKHIFADDFEAAPRNNEKEGSVRKLMEGRQTSYGNVAKTYFVSTPTIKQLSNIEPVYLLGDQRKWHWTCPHCQNWIELVWHIKTESGMDCGIVWELDANKKLINKSVAYKCQSCGELIKESQKYDLNLAGKWIPTAEPKIENYVSYHLNALVIPPGFVTWVDLVKEWIEACPAGQPVNKAMLQTFLNIRMGQTWEETGESPKVLQLTKNTGGYHPGTVPDVKCDEDQNGKIILLTMSADLNGIMDEDAGVFDVRLDWEVVGHASNGQTYSIDQGSIGTFKRSREKSKVDKEKEADRERWTYHHNVENSVWTPFKELMNQEWECQSKNKPMKIGLTVVDTGNFTKLAMQFIGSVKDKMIVGVKGEAEAEFRKLSKDTPKIKQSRESRNLYIVQVNQLKDELSEFMKLREGEDGFQPEGFMNFPEQRDGKYSMRDYFSHFEGEKRMEQLDSNGEVIGFAWEKKHSSAVNHFWDVRVYTLAAREIYLDIFKKIDPKLSKLKSVTWSDFVSYLGL